MGYYTYVILAVPSGTLSAVARKKLIAALMKAEFWTMFRSDAKWYTEIRNEFAQITKPISVPFYLLCRGEEDNDTTIRLYQKGVETEYKINLLPLDAIPKGLPFAGVTDISDDDNEVLSDAYETYRIGILEAHLKLLNLEEVVVPTEPPPKPKAKKAKAKAPPKPKAKSKAKTTKPKTKPSTK